MTLTTVKAAGIAADSIDETKIADNGIDSEHYNDGSIDHAHLANDAVDGDNIADDSINSEHYVDGSIDEAHIANDAVSLAKMAGLARGKIIYGDSSGNPAALAVGSNGQVLKSDGTDIAWGTDSGGATLSGSTDNTIVTVTGSNAMQGEANLKYDGSTLTIADVDADNVIELGYGSTGNNNAYIDFVGDTTYTDYGLRLIRTDSGANSSSALVNRGTGALQINAQDAGTVELMQNNTVRLEVESDGDVKVNTGNLIMGTSGKGISFAATSDGSGANISELLDDYEEGTWTPTLTSSGTDPSVTYTNRGQGGGYVKVGAMVTCWYYSEISAVNNTPSGTLRMSGLPFQAASAATGGESASMAGWMRVGSGATGSGVEPYWRNVVGTSYLLLQYRNESDGSQSNPGSAAADLPSNYFSIGTICYRTDS